MKIAVDAGHGLHTPGKRTPDGSLREWQSNHKVAEKVVKKLSEYEGVISFRTDDPTGERDVPLNERTDKANREKADLFVSIHANANGSTWNEAQGIETFVYVTKPKEALMLATNVQNHCVS